MAIHFSPFDIKRLESYANNMLDYHVILDLLPNVATLYFERRLGQELRLSAVQSSILLALGNQRKAIEDIEVCVFIYILKFPSNWSSQNELQVPVSQGLALFMKVIRKITTRLTEIQKAAISASLSESRKQSSLEDSADADEPDSDDDTQNQVGQHDLKADKENGDREENLTEEQRSFKEKQREMIQSLDLSK